MPSSSGDEKRRQTREPLTLKVEYGDAEQLVSDYTENISRGGTFILTERLYDEGTPIKVVLSFPGLLKPIPIAGTVKWVRREPPEERGIGIEFDVASVEAAARLDNLVKRIGAGDPELIGQMLKVLVVEDNPHVATLIRDGLSGGSRRELHGRVAFQFETATNGREALDLLRSQRFDVLIIDIYLPILDGTSVISTARALPDTASIPIIAMSAGGAQARDAALAAGADFFLEKPMRLQEILATMRRLARLD